MARSSSGKQVVVDSLIAEGVRHVFGNPGTTELPLLDALADNGHIDYVLCLQEAAALSMADAYAHASGSVGFVNLHVAPGLGNAIGSLYNAREGDTPLLVMPVPVGTASTPTPKGSFRCRCREPDFSESGPACCDKTQDGSPLMLTQGGLRALDAVPE